MGRKKRLNSVTPNGVGFSHSQGRALGGRSRGVTEERRFLEITSRSRHSIRRLGICLVLEHDLLLELLKLYALGPEMPDA